MRFISAVLAACMMAALPPAAAFAEDEKVVKIGVENFPDQHFRDFLNARDKDKDGYLCRDEIAQIKKITPQDPNFYNVADVTGIEYLTDLEYLDLGCYLLCGKVKKLDLSKNTKLTEVWIQRLGLTELNISGCSELVKLYCSDNYLTKLDVSNCSKLTTLYLDRNNLQELDVRNNPELETLNCGNHTDDYAKRNSLKELDLKNNNKLSILNCAHNKLTELDLSNKDQLSMLDCSYNDLTELDLNNKDNLHTLECIGNNLTELDVGGKEKLWLLNCSGNDLTELDVTKNDALLYLYCSNNKLTELDVSNNDNLKELYCVNNKLTSLSAGNTAINDMRYFRVDGNKYIISVGSDRTFDLKKLPDGFDITRVVPDSWSGGTVDGTILTVEKNDSDFSWKDDSGCGSVVTYQYDCGKDKKETFTLIAVEHKHSYGEEWKKDETSHWNECTDPGCPDSDKGTKASKADHHYGDDGTCEVCGYAHPTESADGDSAAGGEIGGAVAAAIVGGAAAWGVYETGTGIYRIVNMKGIPLPTTRAELAKLIWERAGKPEPENAGLYADIAQDDTDLQKAAHWMVEQDLMEEKKENRFRPEGHVTKLRVCTTWEQAKQKGLIE